LAVPPDRVTVEEADKVVKAPVVAVVAPTVPLMLIEAVPVKFVTTPLEGVPKAGVTNVGLVDRTTEPVPVEVVTPVPPLATAKVPATVIAPVVAVLGVKPVEPKDSESTPAAVDAFDANKVTTPELFFAYSFMSAVLSANSPFARLVLTGTAEAVAL
jgi:hypothetical protein